MAEKLPVWRCRTCKAILGFFEGGDLLRIKYKDLIVYVTSETRKSLTKVERICRFCGTWNVTWLKGKRESDSAPLKEQLERIRDDIEVKKVKP